MEVVFTRCAGLDVHKKVVVGTVIVTSPSREVFRETRSFGTMTADLLQLSHWLAGHGVTHVAMESTGEYWKPAYNILEHNFEVLLVNARHVAAVPGRKTDVGDSEWLADLLRHGLLKASFVPPLHQRDLRDLTRFRTTFVRQRAVLVNRVQKLLEGANIKLSSVATDIMGVSGRLILSALLEGKVGPEEMAELSKGRLRNKQEELVTALQGSMRPHHRFILCQLLSQIDGLDATIAHFDEEVAAHCAPLEQHIQRLDGIPGVGRVVAEVIVAEIGTDMSRFTDEHHLSSWAGAASGNKISAGKRYSGRRRKGNRMLMSALTEAAQAAARTKNTYLSAQYHHLARRIGKKKAIGAVAHSILVIAYHLIKNQQDHRDLGGNYFDQRSAETTAHSLVSRLKHLGYDVQLTKATEKLAA